MSKLFLSAALLATFLLSGCVTTQTHSSSGDANVRPDDEAYTSGTSRQVSAFGGTKKSGNSRYSAPTITKNTLGEMPMNGNSTSCAQPKKLLTKLWRSRENNAQWEAAMASPNSEKISRDGFKYFIGMEGKDCSFIRIMARRTGPDGAVEAAYVDFSANQLAITPSGVFGIAKKLKECTRDPWGRGGCTTTDLEILCIGEKCVYEPLDRAFRENNLKSSAPWPEDIKKRIAVLEKSVRDAAEKEKRERAAQAAQAEKTRKEYEARREREEEAYNRMMNATVPRTMYLGAVSYEDNGERSRAKAIYRVLLKRFPDSQEALLASQRLTRLGDVEAVEASSSRAANAAYNASAQAREANYQQCMNERTACYSRCSSFKSGRYDCESGCVLCTR